MNLLRKTIIATTLITTISVLIYIFRVELIKSFIESELSAYNIKISCLDFAFPTSLNVTVQQLCVNTPHANIKLNDLSIALVVAKQLNIKHLDIRSATIEASSNISRLLPSIMPNKGQENVFSPEQLTKNIHQYLTLVSQLNLPFTFDIATFKYTPYYPSSKHAKNAQAKTSENSVEQGSYVGQFSAVNNTMALSLFDEKKSPILAFNAGLPTNSSVKAVLPTADLTLQLNTIKPFILAHEALLPESLVNMLTNLDFAGQLYSQLSYQTDTLTLYSQLQKLEILSKEGVGASGQFELFGELNITSKLNLGNKNQAKNTANTHQPNTNEPNTNEPTINIAFQNNNELQLHINPQATAKLLKNNALPATLRTLLNDNPITHLTANTNGNLTYHLNSQRVELSVLNLQAENTTQTHKLHLTNIALALDHYQNLLPNASKTPNADNLIQSTRLLSASPLAKIDFKLTSPLKISSVNQFTSLPLQLSLQGSVEQTLSQVSASDQSQTTSKPNVITSLHFNKHSSITGNNLVVLTNPQTIKPKMKGKSALLIKQLTTKLQGDIHLLDIDNIEFNLQLENQANKLRANNLIEIKALSLMSKITGNLAHIKINTVANADHVALGNLTITGPVNQPNIAIYAQALPLTDLLSLQIKLPKKVALVDGKLDYHISGKIKDLANINNTPFSITVAVKSLSGEVEDIWIQELNWLQKFQYVAGKFTTLESLPDNGEKNLTVALIDTPTPIAKLSINTQWSYQKNFKISASLLEGELLGGSFSIPNVQWPSQQEHSVNVQLNSIDLAQVLALDKKQGIVVTGNVSGQLPLSFDGEKYTINDGELHNVSRGLIQVINNPAVESLKNNNSQLKLAFDALQNLHYHQLSSKVSMADDGYMLLETIIKGRNPDIDNDVNLNLNLSYDLLGLLESMSITEQFEERIMKGLQKN